MYFDDVTFWGKKRVKLTQNDERNLNGFIRRDKIKKCSWCKARFILPGTAEEYAYKKPHSTKGYYFFCRYNHEIAWLKEREENDKRRKKS